ncbi:hypothetical protein V492_06462 [Pseudogymnoascus sp. VKM F-4246]|nr:hypothetical protein V492_06462 [Pseudogymnoascus sp. VKM F-4246]
MAGFPNLAQLMGDDIVTVYVGPREKRYSVHKALLTSQSEYFEKALNGKFKEADEQTIRLPEDSPDAFDLLIGWLYQNQIPVLGYGPGPFDDFPRGIVVGATKLGKTDLQPNRGTGTIAYSPHEEISATVFVQQAGANNMRDRFHNICTQSGYKQYSQDELRLEDYSLNHRFSDLSRPSPEDVIVPNPFPVSPGRIEGIPHCSPIEPIMEFEEAHQLALIRLCLFAETICWTSLFNVAMSTYIQGESFLAHRPMPTEHIELIYERAHSESPCRQFAADATISQISAAGQIDRNMDLVEQWPTFLEDIFKRLRLSQELSHIHGPKGRGPCEYHVHDTKHQPERCSALSEPPKFMLGAKSSTNQKFVTKRQSWGRSSGVDSGNTGSGDTGSGDETTAGSSAEIRYTTYRPNTGYTTRTLGYDDTTGVSPNDPFGRPGDSMDWGTGYRPWLKGGGFGTGGPFGQAPAPGFGRGFGGAVSPFVAWGGATAPASTNPAAAAASSSSLQNNGVPIHSNNLPPQPAATTVSPANPNAPQTQPTTSAASPNATASTASPAIATSLDGASEAGASTSTPQRDTSNDTASTNQGSNPTFGRISPLASPLPTLTARSMNGDHIFGQSLSSSSSTANPGSLFPSAGPATQTNIPTGTGFAGSTPPPSSSASSVDASRAAPQNTSAASTSPFGLLGARSSPAPIIYSHFGSAPRAPDAGLPENPQPSGPFVFRNEFGAPPSNGASSAAPSSTGTLFGSAPTNLFGLRNGPNVPSSNPTATTTPSNSGTLFGSTYVPSNASMPATSSPSDLFGLASAASNANLPKESADR